MTKRGRRGRSPGGGGGGGGGGWISAAGSAGCSSSDALLSQHLPGPRSPSRDPVSRCVSCRPWVPPVPRQPPPLRPWGCWAPFLRRFCFSRGEVGLRGSLGSLAAGFPMGSYPGLLKLCCLLVHPGHKSGARPAGLWAAATLQMIQLRRMRNASPGISNSLPSPAALERAGGRTRALRQPAPKAAPGAACPCGGREGWQGAGLCAALAPVLGQVLGGPLVLPVPTPEPPPPRSLSSMNAAPR